MLRLLGIIIVIRKTTKPVDEAREGVLENVLADMAMMRDLGTLVPVTANVEERIRDRVVPNVTESDVVVLHYVTFATPWDHVEGAASLDLGWGQRRRAGIWNWGGVDDGCTAGEDEENCLPYARHGDGCVDPYGLMVLVEGWEVEGWEVEG